MKIFVAAARHGWVWMLRLGIILVFLVALLIPLGRLLLPQLGDFRAELERGLGNYLQVPAHIQSLEAAWAGWEPALRVNGFSLIDPEGGAPLLSFSQAVVRIDLPRSLLAGRLVLNHIRLEGLRLILERDAAGRLRLLDRSGSSSPIPVKDLPAWLSTIRSLDLRAAEILVRDAGAGLPPLVFNDLRLSWREAQGGRRLGVAVSLPEALGRRLQVVAELPALGNDSKDWSAAFYIRGDDLKPAAWPFEGVPAGGRIDIALWGDWQGSGVTSLMGHAQARDLLPPDVPGSTALSKRLRKLPELNTQFAWRRRADGWQWKGDWTGNNPRGKEILRAQVDLSAVQGPQGELQRLNGQVGGLRLEDLAAGLAPWLDRAPRALLDQLAPRGEVPELVFDLDLDGPAPRYALTARFRGLSIQARGAIPGLEGVDGNLSLDQNGGRLDLQSRAVQMDSALLRGPLRIDTLAGPIRWRREAAAVRLSLSGLAIANSDLQARLQGDVTLFENGASPFIDLRLDCRDLAIGRVAAYLPAAVLRPKLVEWLDRALVSGRAPVGSLAFHGRLADFPFERGNGVFEARFQIQDTILDYGIDWPRIEELEAEVAFRNNTLRIEAVAGKIFDVDLRQVDARIDELPHGKLEVQGRAQGPSAAMLRFLEHSPVAGRLGHYLRDVQARGDNTLDLDLTIPFDGSPVQVEGRVDFNETTLTLPSWKVSLQRLRGELGFTRDGLNAEGLQLLFRGEPARLDIDTLTGEGGLQFRMQARMGPEALLGDYAGSILGTNGRSPLQGKARWDVMVAIPTAHPDGPGDFILTLASDLEGLAVNLPPPFGKSPGDKRAFTARARRDKSDGLVVGLDYAPAIQAVLELVDLSRQPRFKRGELRINAGPAHLPESPGLSVVARLARLELSALAGGIDGATRERRWLTAIDAQLGELIVRGWSFPQVRLQAHNQGEALAVDLEGESLAGQVYIPHTPSPEVPVGVELRRLALHRNKTPGVGNVPIPHPRAFPPLWMSVEDLVLEGNSLGTLRLSVIPHNKGLKLAVLDLRSGLHHLTASGDWLVTGNRHLSRIQASLNSRELGKTLQTFGYPVGLDRGETEAQLTANWPAPLPMFSVSELKGALRLHVAKGQLLDVEAGVGRVVGLLSLHSLSRRLALDFSDLFQEGLGFDSIDGTFTFRNGHAYTDDLTLKAPSARIDIDGRIGLEDRDYDQVVTVTPRVSSTLPIAGAIAGGPAVGAALFLAERFLRREIDQVARYRYSVTGPWNDPLVQRITSPVKSPEQPGYNKR